MSASSIWMANGCWIQQEEEMSRRHYEDEDRVIHIDEKGKETIYTKNEFFHIDTAHYSTDHNPENVGIINDWCEDNNFREDDHYCSACEPECPLKLGAVN